uniref:Peptidase A2 domain-containing protein n=1 Tax=Amphimedon queenslandica TaxID=400682 RepID=A0A1X7UZ19_AMPQE
MKPGNVGSLVPAARETLRPAIDGDRSCWPHSSRSFYIYDPSTALRFLVDTGAEVSVITPSALDKQCLQKLTLKAANNSSIATYGKRSLTLNLNLRRSFQWVSVIADIAMPILGADFLRHFGLLVDMQYHRLIDNNTQLEVKGRPARQQALCLTLLPSSPRNAFKAILKDYPVVLQTPLSKLLNILSYITYKPQDLPSIQPPEDFQLLN